MNATKHEPSRLTELFRLLEAMRGMYEQLNETVCAKISAMHQADLGEMQNVLEREHALVTRLMEREGLRKQLMDLIGKEIGLTGESDGHSGDRADSGKGAVPRAGRALTVSQLARRLSPMRAKELQARAESLGKVVAQAAQANRVCGMATRTLLHHLQWVFGSVRPQSDPPIVYSGLGGTVTRSSTRLVDMVG